MAVFQSHGLSILLLVIRTECAAKTCEESPQVIPATQHKVADLPCFIPDLGESGITVTWTKHSSKPEDTRVWPVELKRVVWKRGADGVRSGNVSLYLKGVNRSDEGTYICKVSEGDNCLWMKNITLKVKDCEILDHVEVAHNQNATLPCSNLESETLRISKASWGVVKDNLETVILQYPPDNSSTTSLAKRARFSGLPTSGKTSLDLLNAEYTDSQWYRCNLTMGQNQRCFDVKLVVTKQEYNPVVWMSTTTEPPYMTEETPAVTEARNIQSPGRDPVARLSYAAAATIATTVSVMVIMAVLLGVAIGLRRCRHSDPTASLSMSASGDSLRHVYEDVDNLAMTTNALYAFSLYNQNENFYSFKSQ